MQTTILESMYKAKSCLGHVDIDEPPEAYCQVCNSKLETSWQRITLQQDTSMPHLLDDSERGLVGFWVISDACPTCAAKDEETKNRLALRARYDKSGVPPIHQKYTLRARTQPCGRVSLPDSEHQLYAQELCDGYKVPQWVFLGGTLASVRQLFSALCSATWFSRIELIAAFSGPQSLVFTRRRIWRPRQATQHAYG